MKNKKILIVAAHPDDEILGCGGSISRLKDTNQIKIIFMTNGVSSRKNNKVEIKKRKDASLKLFRHLNLEKPTYLNFPDNQMDKIPLLKIIKKIEKKIRIFKP